MNISSGSSSKNAKLIALLLLGIGLILIGLAAMLLLPSVAETASENNGEDSAGLPSVIPAKVSFPAPELVLPDLSGQSFALSDFAGQTVLVNNWAIWCPPCKAELPDLERFYREHQDENFTIIAIEAGSPLEDVTQYVNESGLTFPIWFDPQEKALDAFLNFSLPSSYVIDPTGQVQLAWTGAIRYEVLEKYVAPLLQAQ